MDWFLYDNGLRLEKVKYTMGCSDIEIPQFFVIENSK